MVAASQGPYVHSAPAQYSQPPSGAPPTRSTAPPTAYATHAAPVPANQVPNGAQRDPRDGIGPRDPSQLTLAPSANRVFNVSTRPQQCNEPLYSSLPPPSNQPNQVIQPVSIHPFHHTVSTFYLCCFPPEYRWWTAHVQSGKPGQSMRYKRVGFAVTFIRA